MRASAIQAAVRGRRSIVIVLTTVAVCASLLWAYVSLREYRSLRESRAMFVLAEMLGAGTSLRALRADPNWQNRIPAWIEDDAVARYYLLLKAQTVDPKGRAVAAPSMARLVGRGDCALALALVGRQMELTGRGELLVTEAKHYAECVRKGNPPSSAARSGGPAKQPE